MSGAGLQLGRARGEDRFYIPVKARRNRGHQKQQKQLEENKGNGRARSDKRERSSLKSKVAEDSVPPSVVSRSNLDRFLESTTPTVPAQYFSKTTMRGWRTCDVEFQAYFTLADLWESFKEWSAYGAGVPLVLDGSDYVIQYYVPYLSGIQLYGESSIRSNINSRHTGEDSDGDYYRDSSSNGSSENEFEKALKYTREQRGHHFLTSEISSKLDGVSLSDENSTLQEGFSSDDGESGNSRGCLLFEFLEQDTPYSREPLANKIFDLACCFPGLKTLRSCDLLSPSWISVAWYPIYRIPTGPTLKDLDACFLTYHSLSTPMGGNGSAQGPVVVYPSEMDGIPKINLPSFGMASYKFKGSSWKENGANELQLANSLLQAAENWLKLLQVNHPDFQFFASNGYHR
ncbi:uncharacterized protein LOC120017275 [Tripterygium wilfordii]|uniref:uncharacterized protein LOC120017275 n=1 Tax=Tripterygium wilfordii TaxID=458696 RepID=UPI0018F84351|nr:uncharacterized protein LOC120017275 [Tripterygium wilfordii]